MTRAALASRGALASHMNLRRMQRGGLVSIALTPPTPSIIGTDTQQLTATGTSSDGSTTDLTSSATWESSNASVATVSSTGLVTGVTPGSVTITARSGSVTGTTVVTVLALTLWSADFTALSAGAVSSLPSGLTFARASSATVQTGTSMAVTSGIGTDVARAGRRLDADPIGLVIEEARTNSIADARDTTAASWSVASGATETRPSGTAPDGSTTTATRTQTSGGAYGRYYQLGASTGVVWSISMWGRGTSGSLTGNMQAGAANTSNAYTTAWQRYVAAPYTTTGMAFFLTPCNGGTQDVLHDLHQMEQGAFATEAIASSGGTATRAGERLTQAATDSRDSGRISLAVRLQPKGSSSQYANNMSLWYQDANNRAYINASTRAVVVTIGGVSYTTPVAMSWAANDVLDVYVAAGGSIACEVSYRVNDGSKVTLSTGSPSSLGNVPASTIDVLTAGTSNQFTAWVRSASAYRSGRRPAWAA